MPQTGSRAGGLAGARMGNSSRPADSLLAMFRFRPLWLASSEHPKQGYHSTILRKRSRAPAASLLGRHVPVVLTVPVAQGHRHRRRPLVAGFTIKCFARSKDEIEFGAKVAAADAVVARPAEYRHIGGQILRDTVVHPLPNGRRGHRVMADGPPFRKHNVVGR